jgi:drug/metabolite transporter (DMT)-like permease
VGAAAWLLLLASVIGLGGYLTLYRGLESGHLGLVSAISASYGGVTVILSVLVLSERLTLAAAGGVVLTVTGVVLAPGRADPVGREGARATGVVFGLAARSVTEWVASCSGGTRGSSAGWSRWWWPGSARWWCCWGC